MAVVLPPAGMSVQMFLGAVSTLFQKSEGRDRLARMVLFAAKFARGVLRWHIARKCRGSARARSCRPRFHPARLPAAPPPGTHADCTYRRARVVCPGTPSLQVAPPPSVVATPAPKSKKRLALPATTLELGPLSYSQAETTGPPYYKLLHFKDSPFLAHRLLERAEQQHEIMLESRRTFRFLRIVIVLANLRRSIGLPSPLYRLLHIGNQACACCFYCGDAGAPSAAPGTNRYRCQS
eukprot:SAG22_NODE_306_length_12671_cov_14.743239_16_plen_237_part_00